MKYLLFAGYILLLFGSFLLPHADAKDVVINDGFELTAASFNLYWRVEGFDGSLYPAVWAVQAHDTTGDGNINRAFRSDPFVHPIFKVSEGYLIQDIYVVAGTTYQVSADVCYNNC